MHKRQKQFSPSGIKWPSEVDMPLNKTQICGDVCGLIQGPLQH